MIGWKTLKMSWDHATRTIILQGKSKRTRSTKYIKSKEEFGRWQWFLSEVWHARFRWVDGIGIVSDREDIGKIQETLAEKRP